MFFIFIFKMFFIFIFNVFIISTATMEDSSLFLYTKYWVNGLCTCAGHGLRPVDDEGVHVVELEVLQGRVEVGFDMLGPVITVPQLSLHSDSSLISLMLKIINVLIEKNMKFKICVGFEFWVYIYLSNFVILMSRNKSPLILDP